MTPLHSTSGAFFTRSIRGAPADEAGRLGASLGLRAEQVAVLRAAQGLLMGSVGGPHGLTLLRWDGGRSRLEPILSVPEPTL